MHTEGMPGVINNLKLELWMTVSCQMGAGNCTQALFRSSSAPNYWAISSSPWIQKAMVLLCLKDEALHILQIL